ncbi:MAG: ABC-F type ribosomal protection protein [Clostridia bacterium]|nr:ABC-F type ribosomal protection protein [Clostridia bacterium]
MQIKIQDGVVDLSGEPILKKINIEINTQSKIGIVGRNGCGKTTLLRLLSGELQISKDDPEIKSIHTVSGKPSIGTLNQIAFKDDNVSLIDEIRSAYSDIIKMKDDIEKLRIKIDHSPSDELIEKYTSLLDHFTNLGGFYFEKEYEAAIKRFGFTDTDKIKPLSAFSGGQRTKIAFLKLLLSKPDLLLLDEPTNHLDIDAVEWLEGYLSAYKNAVVIVSHDRMFLDKSVNVIYEIERGKTYKYNGNYSDFVEQKKLLREKQAKEYEAQQKEIARLEELIERFRYKANKAAMAQSKIKALERMELIEPPETYDSKAFKAAFEPDFKSVNDVLSVRELEIGYDKVLSKVSFDIKRGQHVGILGGNGLGKSTLLKTIVGVVPAISGSCIIGGNVKIGYFDQQMAQYTSNKTVLQDFIDEFPSLTDFEARSALGAFLFSGEDVFKNVNVLSGGEKVRLALCKIFKHKPNFLILDEPTNHMDIVGKEALETMLSEFEGTLLFVSHDRYFVKKAAHHILSFEGKETVKWFEFGFDEYTEHQLKMQSESNSALPSPTVKKQSKSTYTTPAKEKSKRERALKKAEDTVNKLEQELEFLNEEIVKEENLSDYVKLSELQEKISQTEEALMIAMEEWENAEISLNEIL